MEELVQKMIIEPIGSHLVEGGVAGHMAHPYDVLTPSRFIGFINDLLKGRVEMYEKVDGANLMFGLDKYGDQVVYLRAKTDKPSHNIEDKFPIAHPGSDAFRAGFKAIKKGIKKLSADQKKQFHLLDDQNKPKYFINTEIIYGAIPNIIPYSESTNYIVFHNYVDPNNEYKPVDVNSDTLNKLASSIGNMKVVAKTVDYIGTPKRAERVIQQKTSLWQFKGPIKIDYDKVKDQLTDILNNWKNIKEIKQLRHEKDPEKQFELMKTIAAKIGSLLLTRLVSRLSDLSKEVPKEHPKIEGLVTKYRKGLNQETLLKVTGDFRELNQALWAPLREELDPVMKAFYSFMMSDIFGIQKVTKFSSQTLKKYDNYEDLFRARSTKKLGTKINTARIVDKINETISNLEEMWKKHEGDASVKSEDIKKALLINGYKLNQFKAAAKRTDQLGEVFKAYMTHMWGWNK